MKVFDAPSIRNVALVGHSGSGKTQLAAALLFDAGAVNRLGRVDEGSTVTDYDEEAIARKHTLAASPAYFEWNKCKVNLIDTPGMGNFLSEARAALRVADAALVVVDAVSGVQVSTEKVWEAAEELSLPRLIVLNRLDRERASMERALESIHSTLGRNCVPLQLPIGQERDFKGVVDLVAMKACTFATDGSGKMTEGAVPDSMADEAKTAREALIEMVAEADDSLMEKFFEAGTLTAIVGPNGAGKTTYFNLISGQLRASEGRVALNGEDITTLPAPLRTRKGLGRAFQLTQLFPALTVQENGLTFSVPLGTGQGGGQKTG